MIAERMGGEDTAEYTSFKSGLEKIQNGESIYTSEREAMISGLVHLQDSAVDTIKSFGNVDGALEKFKNTINNTG
jgi:hypothetical protein